MKGSKIKRLVVLLTLVLAANMSYAYVAPSDSDIVVYQTRAALYVSMGQTADQVAVSLRNYFGKDYFVTRTRWSSGLTDVVVQIGDRNEITYMKEVTTVKDK